MAAPTYITAGTPVTALGTLNVNFPTAGSYAVNDLAILVIETGGEQSALNTPTGWTAFPGTPVTDVATAAGSKLYAFWKRTASTSEAAVATSPDTGDHHTGRIYIFRSDIITGDPYDAITTGTKTTASTTATVPSLTTTRDDTLIVMIVGRPDDSTSTTHFGVPTNTSLTGLAEAGEAGSATGHGGGFTVAYGTRALAAVINKSTLTKAVSTTDTYIVFALKNNISPSVEVEKYYFDGSDAAATDTGNVWTNDNNAFDGNLLTFAETTVDSGTNRLKAEGTNAPSTGGTISQVRARIAASSILNSGMGFSELSLDILTDGEAENLGTVNHSTVLLWGNYTTLSTPTGGWTWSKIAALEAKAYVSLSDATCRLRKIELEVISSVNFSTSTPTLEFTGTDPDTDDVRYNIQVATDTTFRAVTGDYYPESNRNSDNTMFAVSGYQGIGQSFPGDGNVVQSVDWHIKKTGTPPGDVNAAIYAISGTHGTNAVPTGLALATSSTVLASSLSTSFALVNFAFTGGNQITLSSGTNYMVVIEYVLGDASNFISVGLDDTSPSHSGNSARLFTATWSSATVRDFIFYVNTNGTPPLVLDKVSGTDAGFLNTVNSSDTDPFTSGEKASYTVQSALANGTYYWRARGLDPSGTNTYGSWTTDRSFSVTAGGGGGNIQTLTATSTTSATLNRQVIYMRTLTKIAATSATLSSLKIYSRALTASVSRSVAINRLVQYYRTLAVTAGITSAVNRITTYPRTLSSTASTSGVLAVAKSYLRILTATTNNSATMARINLFQRTLSATAAISSTIGRFLSLYRTLTSSAAVTSALTPVSTFFRTLAATVSASASMVAGRLSLRSLTANVSVSTGLTGVVQRFIILSATVARSAVLIPAGLYRRTLSATASSSASLSRFLKHYRTLSVSASASTSLAAQRFFARTLPATVSTAATLLRTLIQNRILSVTAATNSTLTRLYKAVRILPATASSSATLNRLSNYYRTLTSSAGTSTTLGARGLYGRALAASASVSTALMVIKSYVKVLSAGVSVNSVLVRTAIYFRSLAASASRSASLNRLAKYYRTLTATAGGSGVLSYVKSFTIALTASASTSATLAPLKAFFQLLTATASASAALTRNTLRTLTLMASVGVSGVLSRISKRYRTLTATASVSGLISPQNALKRTLTAATSVTVALSTQRWFQKILSASSAISALVTLITTYYIPPDTKTKAKIRHDRNRSIITRVINKKPKIRRIWP